MIGTKVREFKTHENISLDDLVPEANFYRRLEACISLEFVRDMVEGLYSNIGRPSIDPVVFFKLQLIAFFESIRSERKMMETVNLNLAHRWYLGYDLDEALPDHSSLSKIRDRFGLGVFQSFFEKIVEQCVEAGLVWGEELYFDSTKVQANANINGMVERTEYEASHHLEEIFPASQLPAQPYERLVRKFNGKRITGIRKPSYRRVTDRRISLTDPQATPMPFPGRGSAVLGYRDHYVVDGGKARIVLRALVTPASIMDNTPMLDLTEWVCTRWELDPKIAVVDAKYGTEQNIVGLEKAGIKAFLPIPDLGKRTGYYPPDLFRYDPGEDRYVCPRGHQLNRYSSRKSEEKHVYRAEASICNTCPLKSECTNSKSGRHIFRSFHQEQIDKVREYHQTAAYQKAMRKRGYWVEPLFGEAKDFHRLRRFRLRGLLKVNIEGVMIAAGQNLKRLLKHRLEECFCFFREIIEFIWRLFSPTFSTA